MTNEHPNLTLLSKLDIGNLDKSLSLFSDDFVWHYFNPNLPDIEGDYYGVDGFKKFFVVIAEKTGGTFKVEPISATPVGEELIVVHTRNSMELKGSSSLVGQSPIAVDVVVVYRIVNGRIAEGWDIPSAFTLGS